MTPIRVALVGCGAIWRSYHLPVLAGHKGVQLTAIVDHDVKRAAELARCLRHRESVRRCYASEL